MPVIDPHSTADLHLLEEDFRQSRWRLRPYRDKRYNALLQFVGGNWGPNVERKWDLVPVNLVEKAVSTYMRALASNGPQVTILTRYDQLRSLAADAETVLNSRFRELSHVRSIQRWIRDAMFSIGILKAGWVHDPDEEFFDPLSGQSLPVGKFGMDTVSLDDWCHDMNARHIEESWYCGHRYTMTMKDLQEHPLFDDEARSRVEHRWRDQWDEYGTRKTDSLGVQTTGSTEEELPTVQLWEIYLPRDQILITLPDVDQSWTKPLLVQEWKGPKRGPYHYMYFQEVMDNSMPLPPVALWMDLHMLANRLYRKLGRQAENQKTNVLYQEGHGEDALRLNEADDMESIATSNVDALKVFSSNGPDQVNLAFFQNTLDLFNNISGNIDLLAGTGPQSETARQDTMLKESAGDRVDAYKDIVYDRTQGVCEDAAYWCWNDPLRTWNDVRTIPGTEIRVPVQVTPEMRENTFNLVNFRVLPHSMQRTTPAMRIQKIKQILAELGPYLPMMMQSGVTFKWEGLLQLISKYEDMPELRDVLDFFDPAAAAGPVGQPPHSPPVTERHNVRTSVSAGGTDRARRQMLSQAMLSGSPNMNQAQQAQMTRVA